MSSTVIQYQNSILDDVLSVMTTEDLLEFAVECDWLRTYLGESDWLLIKKEFGHTFNRPWREALDIAKKAVVPGLTECRPQQS